MVNGAHKPSDIRQQNTKAATPVPERFAEEIFRYLSLSEKEFPGVSQIFAQPQMDRTYFDNLTDSFRSPHLWQRDGDTWVLRHRVTDPEGE